MQTPEGPFGPEGETELVYYDAVEADGSLSGGVTRLPAIDGKAVSTRLPAPVVTLNAADGPPPGNRVDMVFVGDGYTAAQLGAYASHVAAQVNGFFQEEPFATYENYFQVHRVDVVSAQSGVDNDPNQGVSKDTALDMGFWCGGIERLLCVNVTKAYNFANNAPDVDVVVAVANSNKYGGAGYSSNDLATVSGNTGSATEILIHEMGHGFGDLADEYDYEDGATYNGSEPSEHNISILNSSQMATAGTKWSNWLGETFPGIGGLISTFEGAFYNQFGVYRPSSNSIMRTLGRPFNMVSVERLVILTYHTVNPIDQSSDTGLVHDADDVLFVVPMQPVGHDLDVQWALDGGDVPGATATSLDLATLALSAGPHTVSVTVVDNTPWVRDQAARDVWMTETLDFTVQVSNPWQDLGNGLAGTHGIPDLRGDGTLLPGQLATLSLTNALENGSATLVLGFSNLSAPFKFGVLVPNPDILSVSLPVDALGTLVFSSPWPSGIPSGLETFWQYWIPDPAGPVNFAASNALKGTQP